MSVKNWQDFHFGSPGYQQKVGWDGPAVLHHNSQQLVEVIKENNLLFNGMNIFEIGAGGNRNLKYINDYATEKGIEINLSSNDLHRKESLAGTHESIRDKINFWEADTLSFMVANGKSLDVDLLISSDHLMHVEKTSVITILDIIRDDINPKYIL